MLLQNALYTPLITVSTNQNEEGFNAMLVFVFFNRFGKKSRPTMYDAAPIAYEDYSPDDKPLVTLIKTKDL